MRNKNIAFLIWNLDNGGGTERVSLMLGDYLCNQGYNVTFFSYMSTGHPFFEVNPKIRVVGFEDRSLFMRVLRRIIPNKDKRLHYLIMFFNINVIIDVDMGQAIHSSIAIRGTKCKQITWDHFNHNENSHFSYRQEGFIACKETASKLVVLTKEDEKAYKEQESLSAGFIEQVYNPLTIEIGRFIEHTSKTVIAVGRLEKQKGFDVLLKIWEKVESKHTDWNLEIYGIGQEEFNLKSIIETEKLKNVHLMGRTNCIIEKMRNASIFVLTSRYEGFGLVITEAMTMSLPVVSFNCPMGPSEIVEDEGNGYLVENGDIENFAQKLSLLMEDEDKRRIFGERSYELSQKFKKENIFPKWIEIIESL